MLADYTLLEVGSDVFIRIDYLFGLRFALNRHFLELLRLGLFNRLIKYTKKRTNNGDGLVHAALL